MLNRIVGTLRGFYRLPWTAKSAAVLAALTVAFIFNGGVKAFAQETPWGKGAICKAVDGPLAQAEGKRGEGHAQNHDWYEELKQPGTGYSCCNGMKNGVEGDCRPTRAYQLGEGQKCGDFNGGPGDWCALIDGLWHVVPARTVLEKLAPDGNSHICAGKSRFGMSMIYCFVGGSPKS